MQQLNADYSRMLEIVGSHKNNMNHTAAILKLLDNFRTKHSQLVSPKIADRYFEDLLISFYERTNQKTNT